MTLDGTTYKVAGLLIGPDRGRLRRGVQRQSLAPDVSRWLANPRNEGVADVGGEETVKITGAADDKRVLADVERLLTQAQVVQARPTDLSAGRAPPRPRRRSARSTSTVFTGATDRMLRRLVVTRSGTCVVDLTLTRVDEDQEIEAPKNARPFSELLKRTR